MKRNTAATAVICIGIFFTFFTSPAVSFASISGTVTDTAGSPVEGVLLTFTDESNPDKHYNTNTGTDGRYELDIVTVSVEDVTPSAFQLHQNYPNPFNPTTTIPYSLNRPGHVTLTVYNIMGQKIRTLGDKYRSAGLQSAVWNGRDDSGNSVAAGLYIYQFRFGNQVASKKMLLIDGGNFIDSNSSTPAYNTGAVSRKKPAISNTYNVKISGRDIIDYEKSGITITDSMILDFVVRLVEISEKTVTVEETDNITLSNITEDTITYTVSGQAPEIKTDDILVSGDGSGYLRKVKSSAMEGDKIVIETELAVLTDVVVAGKIDTVFTMDFGAQKIGKGAGVLKSAKGVSLTENGIDLTGVNLYSGKVGNTDLNVTITDGSITFAPSLDIGIEIENSSVEEFHAIAQGDLQFYFDLQVSSSGEINYKNEINLITLYYTLWQWIGPVPVIEVITLEFNAGFEAVGSAEGNLETGFDHTSQVSVGAQYESNEWTPVWEKSAELNKHDTQWPATADLNVKGYVRPVISVKFYAVAGPYINIIPYLDFDGEVGGEYAWFWELTGGIESNLGFDVSVIGYGIADYSTNLLSWETVIASDYEESSNGGEPKNITFVTIPGGTFQMGDEDGDLWDGCRPVHTVTVSSFDMSVYEITNGQYAAYLTEALASGDITVTSSSVTGKTGDYIGEEYHDLDDSDCEISYSGGSFTVDSGKENRPVVEVTWYGSKAFALYYGLDLAREAEWEYACRGGKQYKYGTDDGTISSSKANYNRNVGHTTDVGSYPANPFGLYDMSGNVWEWCSDWYGSYPSGSVNNPTGAQTSSDRVSRGGSWGYDAYVCRSAFRYGYRPDYGYGGIGFRVVRRLSSH